MATICSKEYCELFVGNGDLNLFISHKGKDIHTFGTLELIEYINDKTGERYTLRLDVLDDFKTINYHVKGNTDDEYLEVFDDFHDAYIDFVSKMRSA